MYGSGKTLVKGDKLFNRILVYLCGVSGCWSVPGAPNCSCNIGITKTATELLYSVPQNPILIMWRLGTEAEG